MVEARGSGSLARGAGDMMGRPLPCIVDGLLQILLCTSKQVSSPDESYTCQQSSPGGCRRHEEQVAARSCPGQVSWAGQAGVGTCSPWPSTAPKLTSQYYCCPSHRSFYYVPPPKLPLPAQPQAPCSPGLIAETLGKKNPGKKKILYICRSEIRPRPCSSSSRPFWQVGNWQTGSWW